MHERYIRSFENGRQGPRKTQNRQKRHKPQGFTGGNRWRTRMGIPACLGVWSRQQSEMSLPDRIAL
jgi:hypothetical protein